MERSFKKAFYKDLLLRILRVALPALVLIVGMIPGSYILNIATQTATEEILSQEAHNYYSLTVFVEGNWAPMLTMVLAAACGVLSAVSLLNDKEIILTIALHCASIGFVASLYTLLLQTLTWLGWLIAGLMFCQIVVVAKRLMELEDKSRRGR